MDDRSGMIYPQAVRSFHLHCVEPELRDDESDATLCTRLHLGATDKHFTSWLTYAHRYQAIQTEHRGPNFLSANQLDWRLRVQAQTFLLLSWV